MADEKTALPKGTAPEGESDSKSGAAKDATKKSADEATKLNPSAPGDTGTTSKLPNTE